MKYGYPKTYAFFQKYSSKFLYIVALVLLLFIFAPQQEKHYMKADIADFTEAYYLLICTVIAIIIVLAVFLMVWKRTTIKKAFISLIPSLLLSFLISFFFQSIIIGMCLWINRSSVTSHSTVTYQLVKIPDSEHRMIIEKESGKPLDKEDESRMDIFSQVIDLKLSDTFNYTFYKGLFGITTIPEKQ